MATFYKKNTVIAQSDVRGYAPWRIKAVDFVKQNTLLRYSFYTKPPWSIAAVGSGVITRILTYRDHSVE